MGVLSLNIALLFNDFVCFFRMIVSDYLLNFYFWIFGESCMLWCLIDLILKLFSFCFNKAYYTNWLKKNSSSNRYVSSNYLFIFEIYLMLIRKGIFLRQHNLLFWTSIIFILPAHRQYFSISSSMISYNCTLYVVHIFILLSLPPVRISLRSCL
jgi:hypothetical protein